MKEINLGKTLSELRAAKGVTQDDVAAALSVSNKTISKWENGDSSPDLSALTELAEYYAVSTDYLLGLRSESKSTDDFIAEQFKNLDRRDTALKLFEMLKATFPPCMEVAGTAFDDVCDNVDTIPVRTEPMNRYSIALHELYHFLVCSDDVNFAVIQLRNQANFKWLLDEKKQKKITELLSYLADPDAMKILYFIHSTGCSENFTAEYMAKHTAVEYEKAEQILRQCCDIGICSSVTAHLKSRETKIYESFGDGLILSILSIAYERMCGRNCYNYNFNGRSKMIRGEKK